MVSEMSVGLDYRLVTLEMIFFGHLSPIGTNVGIDRFLGLKLYFLK